MYRFVMEVSYTSKFGLSWAEPSSQTVDRRRRAEDFGTRPLSLPVLWIGRPDQF